MEKTTQQSAVDFLAEEINAILGKIGANNLQDYLLTDAINKAKEMEKRQLIAFGYMQIENTKAEIEGCFYLKLPEQIFDEIYGE
jgi:glycosyltransferase A (GT-A) superfamily protein (DUF2064 family)